MRPSNATTDFDLLAKWGEGDRSAGNDLFHRHFDAIFRFFHNKTTAGVEDLVQQTFLACVESRSRFRRDASFRTFLFATARNILLKHYDKTQRERAADFSVDSVFDLSPSPSRVLADRAEHRLLLEGLRRIPLDYQIALELYHWEGMTGPQLAEALGIPEPTVRSRIRRGTQQLRAHLTELANSGQVLSSTLDNLSGWARSVRDCLSAR